MRVLIVVLLLAVPTSAAGQLGPPPDGLYEDFPSIFMQPSVPLSGPPTLLARWVDVRSRSGVTTVTFEPDARIAWRITWGPHGPTEKVTLVDGAVWTRSAFAYDAAGHLASKAVTGHGAESGLTFAYTTDPTGAITARTTRLASGATERVEITRTSSRTTVTVDRGGSRVRRDRYDAQRRLLETRFYVGGHESARLTYTRDTHGALLSIQRRLGPRHGAADPLHPDPIVDSDDVSRVLSLRPIELDEALLLLGAATSTDDQSRGVARRIRADFSGSHCWMNDVDAIVFDAAGLAIDGEVSCICGLCVDASLLDESERARATSVQHHFTTGPWIRLDDAVDVTADHAIMTPDGPREVGTLHAGDVVLADDGSPHALVSVEALPEGELRLGANLVTPDGVFRAGGFLFASEEVRACAP